MKKALFEIKAQEKIAEITPIEERKIDMMEGVGEEHIYKTSKYIERIREKLFERETTCMETIKPELSYIRDIGKNNLASSVLLSKEFTKGENSI